MTQVIVKETDSHRRNTVHELLNKHGDGDRNKVNLKRERFLALLQNRYGYTNDAAVDELERLLKSFYRMNKSLNIHIMRPDIKNKVHESGKGESKRTGYSKKS